jgi:tRNA threonylcarbamoyladenosine biosynthesis protein TsaE
MTYTATYLCATEQETQNLAKRLSNLTKIGDVWALYGTLGMGKSVFARAFIQHLCPVEDVPSPTFTLVQTYPARAFEIYHYDLYRLKDPDEIWELNIEEAVYGAVCLIEWPEKAGPYLPKNLFRVDFESVGSHARKITVTTESDEKAARLKESLK